MKKIITLLFLSSLLIFGAVTVNGASLWSKYVATDKSYSFHYPSGWKVSSNYSVASAENSKTDEQLMMAMIPYDQLKRPKDFATDFLNILKKDNPYVSASNWQGLNESMDELVIFDLADKVGGKKYSGLGIVVTSNQQAIWFSYFAPESDYYQIRGNNILQGFISSLATGSTSKAPSIDYNIDVAARIDSNAKDFLFVLEFTLGAPFTTSQENVIINELKDSWRYLSDEKLTEYDQYTALVSTILKMKQKELEELRTELEKAIREWLEVTDQSDPAVKIISSTLKNRGKVVIAGEPPLTEMSLNAYSEIIAYSRLLQKDSKATPDQISAKSVSSIKKQVKKVWKTFTTTDKKDIATTPGLWFCLRAQLKYASKEDQDKIKDNLKKLESVTRDIDSSTNTSSGNNPSTTSDSNKPMSMSAHWCLMQMKQQTFNTYMWSRGFNYLPATGKLW